MAFEEGEGGVGELSALGQRQGTVGISAWSKALRAGLGGLKGGSRHGGGSSPSDNPGGLHSKLERGGSITPVRRDSGHQVLLPITKGDLDLGPWEQVFYAEFDGQRRKRVIVKAIGE